MALEAEARKVAKYSELGIANIFIPIAVETLGVWGPQAWDFVSELGRRIAVVSGDVHSTTFLRQRIDVTLQRGNAASILGTLALTSTVVE